MDQKLYDYMDWAEIEAVLYSEEDNPHKILGPHLTEDGVLIQVYDPTAASVSVEVAGKKKLYALEEVELDDQAGYFAVLIPGRKIPDYTLVVTHEDGAVEMRKDPYAFEPVIDARDRKLFSEGIHYEIYDKLGAHPMTINGVSGVLFAVWAPNAVRVSVVGDFNLWDGRRHQMRRLEDSGIFELFIPGMIEGDLYKYELKVKGGMLSMKADPYGYACEKRPDTANLVWDISKFTWNDEKWLAKRKKADWKKEPMMIYEVHPGSWKMPDTDEEDVFYNYREIAPMLADYVQEMGYTHIELMPVMEHPLDESWGYQVTGYYAATSRYGTPDDFAYFMDYMHRRGIGVILDWVPAHFPRDTFGLATFDGTCLYEHLDPKQGAHPHWGTLIYNYGRPQVANFLIANALFWVEKYHADGIRMDAVASMLYLDYGKNDGEWVANMYGGNENLEAMAMLRQLSEVFHEREDGVLLIAEESTAWPDVTKPASQNGLGFDMKWNMGWMNDFTDYMKCDPLFRKGKHGEITFSMVYAYSENFILVLSHDEVVHGKGSMLNKMPGDDDLKFANLRAAYGFFMAHPGKKLLFMGQEFAQRREWCEKRSLDWELLDEEEHQQMQKYVKDLIRFYKDYPALYREDFDSSGFEWVSALNADDSILTFVRKSGKPGEDLFVVVNFTPVVHEDYLLGVPYAGKYKETFNSDNTVYGGQGNLNPKAKQSKPEECDGRENSIRITVPPLGIAVFQCTKAPEKKPVSAKTGKAAIEKEAEKKKAARKPAPAEEEKNKGKVSSGKNDSESVTGKENAERKEPQTEMPKKRRGRSKKNSVEQQET